MDTNQSSYGTTVPSSQRESREKAQHTPGPWKIHEDRHGWLSIETAAGDYFVARVDGGPFADANAQLIAAAPETAAERDQLKEINRELLESAREACRLAYAALADFSWVRSKEYSAAAAKVLRAALTKAEGGQG